MLIILSPSKEMGTNSGKHTKGLNFSIPELIDQTASLAEELSQFQPGQLAEMLGLNKKLAENTFLRYQMWDQLHTLDFAVPAIFLYTGEAYRGFKALDFDTDDLKYANRVLRILSALYGVLRPLDLIRPYRLDMGIRQPFCGEKNLYDFWGQAITRLISQAIEQSPGDKALINLASNEYSMAIDMKQAGFPVVTPEFRDETKGELKIVSVYAKRARGMMTRFIVANRIEKIEELKAFDMGGYIFDPTRSTEKRLVFIR